MNNNFNRIAVIGSRETPKEALESFISLVGSDDVIVTSGNAYGADQFSKYWKKNIQYLPWQGYNKELGYGLKHIVAGDVTIYDNIIFKLFPWIRTKSQGVLKLIRRNMCMIAGIDGKHPVDAVFYWAEETNGVVKGGTRYAVDFARSLGIPTFNVKYHKPTVICALCGTTIEEEHNAGGVCPECYEYDIQYRGTDLE